MSEYNQKDQSNVMILEKHKHTDIRLFLFLAFEYRLSALISTQSA